MEPTKIRLLAADGGWWGLLPGGAAWLPSSAVSSASLTVDARDELASLGLMTPPKSNYYGATVLTSTSCNLGCPYCFQNIGAADSGRFDPPRIEKFVLSTEKVDRTAAFILSQMENLGYDRLRLLLFGGEPLLNPKACLSLLRRFEHQVEELDADMVTNGVLLKPALAEQLADAGLKSAQITLDGNKEIHDKTRATRAGRPTFDKIMSNIRAAQTNAGMRFGVRVNVTTETISTLMPLVHYLADSIDPDSITLDFAVIRDYDWNSSNAFEGDPVGCADAMISALSFARSVGFNVAAPRGFDCIYCGDPAGASGAVISADGNLYSCWETAGRPGYEVGHIDRGYDDYPSERWLSCHEFGGDNGENQFGRRLADEYEARLMGLLHNDPAPEVTSTNTRSAMSR